MKIWMRNALGTLVLVAAFFCASEWVQAAIVDRVVAVVNGEVITLSELEDRAAPVLRRYLSGEVDVHETEATRKEILAKLLPQLIDEHLVQEEAERLGIRVEDADVEDAIERISAENGMTRDQLTARLAAEGLSLDDYRKGLREQIKHSQLINAQVRAKIVVTEEQIQAYIEKHRGKHESAETVYQLQHICVIPSDSSDPEAREEALQRATQARKALMQGRNFSEVAREYSDVPSKQDDGNLGGFTEKEMASFVKDAIVKLKPGEFSEVIDTPMGWQIFRVREVQQGGGAAGGGLGVEEARQELYRRQINARFEEWLQELRSKSTIRILL